jgi:ABC-type transporter Mla MlaB component
MASVLRPAGIVDCWIGIDQDGDRRVLRLAGKLDAAQVPELLLACTRVGPLHVDLTDLVSIDAAGVEALQRVRAQGAILQGVPGYIRLKLDSPPREGC